MYNTIWILVPPILAIILALLTKEVYISLIAGILSGALLYTQFHPIAAIETTFDIMKYKTGDNAFILMFLVMLGTLVTLIKKSGASTAYGNYASGVITSKKGALLATTGLGSLIFIDDYFNCLTVGTIMQPITDKHNISRAKLAYIIDSTAAPVCILSPISSWAAAVGSSLTENSGMDGFVLYLNTIPFNLYAIFTIIFMLFIILSGRDYFKMASFEINATKKAIFKKASQEISHLKHSSSNTPSAKNKGTVKDLIFPILCLIISCILAMLYSGGFFHGNSLINAFKNCDSAKSLLLGSFVTLVFTFLFYIPRHILSFHECCQSISEGFKTMTPAILILCLSWTLSGICSSDYLNLGALVSSWITAQTGIVMFLPAVFFIIALFLSFATGTSWGTFSILIPIASAVINTQSDAFLLGIAAILAGAVCGDHISPISDTTILASAGAQCIHLEHVSTQIPYAACAATCSFIGFLAGGIAQNGWIALITGGVCLCILLILLYKRPIDEMYPHIY